MNIVKTIKAFALTVVLTSASLPIMGQDLIARMAPVDRKIKQLDTLALQTIQERESFESPSAALYQDWDNRTTHYKASDLPETYRINLKGFRMPTQSRVITSQYGPRWGRQHKGLDIKVYIGDTIRAAWSGKVRIVKYEARGYGNYVVIRHSNGLETYYAHMSKHLVRENQTVRAGQPIGLGGNTGRSTGSHLHFETRLCGVALNPALFFDFRNQDVTGDYYVFRKSTMSSESRRATATTGRKVSGYTKEEVYGGKRQEAMTSKREDENKMTAHRNSVQYHTVEPGETVYSIARKYDIPVEQLLRLNHYPGNKKVVVGEKVRYS